TNCLALTTNATVVLSNESGVFLSVGGADHYLATNTYRNLGTTSMDAALSARIKTKTTYPPVAYSNITISVDTTFGPQAQRDTDAPDLGYHYDALDYAFGGVTAEA